jgi:hypothetical protein
MAKTKARIGYGTLIKYGDGASPQNFTKLAEVRNIDGFGVQRNEVEATHMESPGEAIERIGSLKDGQVITITCNMTVDNVDILKGFVDDGDVIDWQLAFASPLPTYAFSAVPLTWKITGMTPSGLLEVVFGSRLTGDIV